MKSQIRTSFLPCSTRPFSSTRRRIATNWGWFLLSCSRAIHWIPRNPPSLPPSSRITCEQLGVFRTYCHFSYLHLARSPSFHHLIDGLRAQYCCLRTLVCASVPEFVIRGVHFEVQACNAEGERQQVMECWYGHWELSSNLGRTTNTRDKITIY